MPALGFGLGFRSAHGAHILEHLPDVDWFEIISENYMENEGKAKRVLERVASHYPIVMHGVSLSIGSCDPINLAYIDKLKALIDWVKPVWVSDHVCFTGVAQKNTHDLLPIPYTEESLMHLVERIKQVQEMLERVIALENPSTYLEYTSSSMPEAEFLARMVEKSGCKLLLDVNNVYVSCFNHKLDTKAYIDTLPLDSVIQIHLAGHQHHKTHIIDTHDSEVSKDVLALYHYVIAKAGRIPNTMVEWDTNIPDFPHVFAQLEKAKAIAQKAATNALITQDIADFSVSDDLSIKKKHGSKDLLDNQLSLQAVILDRFHELALGNIQAQWIHEKQDFSSVEQLTVYAMGYRTRLYEAIWEDYPVLAQYLGKESMDAMVKSFVSYVPSQHYNLSHYSSLLPEFLRDYPKATPLAKDIARLEYAIAHVAVARETAALKPEHLAHLTPEALLSYPLKLREASTLLHFSTQVNALYRAIKEQSSCQETEVSPVFLAVYRHEEEVFRLELEEIEFHLLQILSSGVCLGDALEALHTEKFTHIRFDDALIENNLSGWFSRWLHNGLFAFNEITA